MSRTHVEKGQLESFRGVDESNILAQILAWLEEFPTSQPPEILSIIFQEDEDSGEIIGYVTWAPYPQE